MTAFGQIRGQIRIDAAKAIAEYAALRAANASTVANLRAASTAFVSFGVGAIAAGAAVGALFGKAVSAAATFQKKIDFFGAVTDATQADMQAVADKALEMGKTTIFSADQMADAFVEFGKAGVSTKDIINGVADSVVALASAADIDLTQASDIIISTMQTFKLHANQTMEIANLLAGAANSSIVDVQDLGVSLKYVGGIAAATGIPLENLVTALSLLGQAGIKGSTAGTSLRQILVSLNATSGKAQKTLKALGIITEDNNNLFIDAAGHLKPLDQVFQILKEHTADLTDAERLSALKIIFNNRALAAANILLKDGTKGFSDMSVAIGKVTATDVAHKRLDNLAGDWLRLKNSIQTMLIQAGGPFQNFLRQIVQGLTAVVRWFANLDPHIQTAILAFIGIVGALLILAGTVSLFIGVGLRIVLLFIQVGKAIQLLASFIRILVIAFRALAIAIITNPILLIIAAIVALGVAFFILWKRSETFRNAIKAVGQAFLAAFTAVVAFFKGIPAFFAGVWSSITGGFKKAWDTVVKAFQTAGKAITTAIHAVWDGIETVIVHPIEAAVNGIVSAWKAIINAFTGPIKAVIDFVKRDWRILALLTGPFGIVVDIITAQWAKIVAVFRFAVNLILVPVRLLFNTIVTIVTTQIRLTLAVITAVWNAIRTATIAVWNAVSTAVRAAIDVLVTIITTQFNIIRTIITAIWNAQLAVTRAVWNGILAVVRTVVNAILVIFRALSAVATIVANAFRAAYRAVVSVLSTLFGYLRGFVGNVLRAIGNVFAPLVNVGITLINGLISGIGRAITVIWRFGNDFVKNLLRTLGNPLKALYNFGVQVIQGLVNGIADNVKRAFDAVKHLLGNIINGAKSLLGIGSPSKVFHQFGAWMMEGLANGITQGQRMAASALNRVDELVKSHALALSTTFGANVSATSSLNRFGPSKDNANGLAIDKLTGIVSDLVNSQAAQSDAPVKANLYLDPLGTQLLATTLKDSDDKTEARRGR